jgi:hypothetical protein
MRGARFDVCIKVAPVDSTGWPGALLQYQTFAQASCANGRSWSPLLLLESSMRCASFCGQKTEALVLLEDEGFERQLVVPPPFASQSTTP